MKKKFYSRKILSVLLALAVVIGCLPFALLGASAAIVDYVATDDFTVGGKATLDGTATERADAWEYYDYAARLTDNQQPATVIANGATISTKGTNDVLNLSYKTNAIYTYKNWSATDKIKQMVVDNAAFALPGRYNDMGICVYFNTLTGESITLYPNSRSGSVYQLCLAQTYYNGTALVNAAGNNNYFDCVNNGMVDYNIATYPAGLFQRFIIDYTYTSNVLTSIKITSNFYTDNTYGTAIKTHAYTIKVNGAVFDSGCTSVRYNDNFIAGIRAGTSTDRVSIDAMTLTLAHEVTQQELQAKADAFVTANKTNLLLDASGVNADNAASVLATAVAYNVLNSDVKAILANIDIDGTMTDIGAKITVLNAAAAPFVPTEKQLTFEAYYAENSIGEKTAMASGDDAVMEQALTLYNAIESAHKPNVADKYAKIINLIKANYITKTATQETVSLPEDTFVNTTAIIKGSVDPISYPITINTKFNAYNVFNNSGTQLVFTMFNIGTTTLSMRLERGITTTTEGALEGIKAVRVTAGLYGDKVSKIDTTPESYDFATDTFGSNLNLNGVYTPQYCIDASKALFINSPIITETNPYMNICYSFEVFQITANEAFGGYRVFGAFKVAIYYDANANNVMDSGEYAILNKGFGDSIVNFPFVTKSTAEKMPTTGYGISGTAPALYKDTTIVTNLLTTVELTPAEQFVADHEVLSSSTPAGDDALAMYVAYQALGTEVKTAVDALVNVESVITNANIRPATNGATIRTNIDQNIAFYTDKPTATTSTFRIKELGSVLCGLGYAITNNLTVTKGEEGTVYGSEQYAAGDTVSNTVLTYLSGTDISGKANWSTYIVARSFAVWTDGTNDIILYSVNDDARNTTAYDSEFDSTGMVIRSVNGIMKSIAGAIQGKETTLYENNKGVATAFGTEYANVSYADLTNLDSAGLVLVGGIKDSEATLKMLVAYAGLVTAVVSQ